LSLDGRKLAYSKGRSVANIWRVPILEDREAGWQHAEPLTFDEANTRHADVFPDGERLVFSSDRGGYANLWTLVVATKELSQLTNERVPDAAPRVSRDGQRITFYSYRSGNRDIWVIPSKGGPAVQLTRDEASEMFPSWSPDGSQIAFYSGRGAGMTELFAVPASGGDVEQLASRGEASKYFPQWSPDGGWLAFATSEPRLYRIPISGGTEQRLTDTPIYYFRWSSDSSRIYFRSGDDLFVLSVADRKARRLTRFSGRVGNLDEYFAVGPAHLYFHWGSSVGDIWVLDVVTDQE
jgi:Tol biopolymer transport system component